MLRLLVLSLIMIQSLGFSQHHIIPEPVSFTSTKGLLEADGFTVKDNSKLKNTSIIISQFENHVESIGLKKDGNIEIQLSKDKNIKAKEGYHLSASSKGITIKSNTYAGFYYGFQTLKQLFPAKADQGKVGIQFCEIADEPRFEWRGLMLDVSRHFFTVDEVKAYIELMASYKFNTFHWHLTDDHGWRVEIKSLPKLTEVGAWRGERYGRFGESRTKATDEEPKTYGGFYTQAQIKDIVAFAQDRNVRIVPEIDVPGHSMALLAAYPRLSTKKEKVNVSVGDRFAKWFGDGTFKMYTENMLDPTNEKVYETLDKIYGEIATLFPYEYIHMGGDECYKGYWEESDEVQKFMKKNKMKDMHDLQAYFIDRVQKIIESKGKKMIGWDEITEGHLNKDAAVMSWQGMKGGIEAAKLGHNVVMSPTTYAYLDYTQGDESIENNIYKSLSLEKTYEFEPVPAGVDPKFILGAQANLWTEAVPTMPFAFYMTYPRAFSIAETAWSPKEKKNWNSFIERTLVHFDRFDDMNINISKAVLDPIIEVYKEGGKLMCELTNNIPHTEIYYSIDNTYPMEFGTKYTGPFEIPEGELSLRTQTFLNSERIGRSLQVHRTELEERAKK